MLALNLRSHPRVDLDQIDQRVFLNLSWSDFELFLKARGDTSANRITYLDGLLEIMSPSTNHELIKTNLARLIESWAIERDVELNGYGSWTIKQKRRKSGVEPDECYVIGLLGDRKFPDIALEVVWTSGGIDKLAVYHRLKVPEVWIWENGGLQAYCRRPSTYVARAKSELLPELDLAVLSRHSLSTDQHGTVKRFIASLRRH